MMPTPHSVALDAANRLIRNRRSIKPALMRDDPIPREIFDALFENANWAPTHGRTEPWRFKVFEGDARRRLAAALAEFYQALTPADAFRPDKFEKLGKDPLRASAVVVICMERQAIEKIPEVEEIEAVACAVQNLFLTASALGLAAYWSTPPVAYSERMKAFLGLGVKDRCLGLFYLGTLPAAFAWPAGDRRPAAEKVEWMK